MNPDITTFELDTSLYNELNYFFDQNATIKHCIGILDRFVLHGVRVRNMKPHMNRYFVTYYIPFFRQLLRNIVILGWCPYHLKKTKMDDTGETIIVPEVIPPMYMRCTLEVDIKKVQYEYKFYDLDMLQTCKKNVHVFIFSDNELISNNHMIHSILNGTLHYHRLVQQIMRFTIQSEYVRSNPPIFLKKIKDGTSQSRSLYEQSGNATDGGRQIGSPVTVADPRSFARSGRSRVDKLKNASTSMVDNLEFHMEEMESRARSHQSNYYSIGLEYYPQWHNNLFICPPDMELAANPHLPDTRVDQLTMERNLTSIIYKSFGIPESMIGNLSNSTVNANRSSTTKGVNVRNSVNIMDLNIFESTLERYKNFFQDCFVVLYQKIFKVKLIRDAIVFESPLLYKEYIENVVNVDNKNEEDTEGTTEKEDTEGTTEKEDTEGTIEKEDTKKKKKSNDTPPKKNKKQKK